MSKPFRIEGLSDINRALGDLPRAVGKATLVRVGKARLQPMADEAKQLAPVDEGDLRESIIVSTRQGTKSQRIAALVNKAAVEVAMGPTADGYPEAVPQEFGFYDSPGSPYMRPAWDNGHRKLLDGIAGDLGKEVAKAAARHARRQARRAASGR
jgi:hypothetical protein